MINKEKTEINGFEEKCKLYPLFSPFFTFLRAIVFRPFRLSLALTICPWVSEDGYILDRKRNVNLLVTEFAPNEIKMLKISCWQTLVMKNFQLG